jgi:hypothetical protein
MKKNVFTIALFLVFSFAFSQNYSQNPKIKLTGNTKTETRSTSDYDKITIGGSFEVTFVKGKEGEIKITADEAILAKLITKCNSRNLEIKMENGSNYSAKILITIPIEEISKLNYAGSGSVKSEIALNAKTFKLDFSGSGNMNLPITAKNLKVDKTGSGNLTLSGTTTNFEINSTGSGNSNAKDLKSKSATVMQSGSGDIKIFTSDKLEVQLVGSGSLNYYGKPEKVNKTVVGSGSVSTK